MYYREFERIKKMERLLEKLAYFSVFLDLMVAVATFFIIRGNANYAMLLTVSNYMLTIEVGFTALIFIFLVALRHYRKIIDTMALASFRGRYPESSRRRHFVLFRPVFSFLSFLSGD